MRSDIFLLLTASLQFSPLPEPFCYSPPSSPSPSSLLFIPFILKVLNRRYCTQRRIYSRDSISRRWEGGGWEGGGWEGGG